MKNPAFHHFNGFTHGTAHLTGAGSLDFKMGRESGHDEISGEIMPFEAVYQVSEDVALSKKIPKIIPPGTYGEIIMVDFDAALVLGHFTCYP